MVNCVHVKDAQSVLQGYTGRKVDVNLDGEGLC
jgi:hypothetical protein